MDPFMNEMIFGPATMGLGGIAFSLIFLVVTLWTLIWKALALWHAARNRQKIWFVVLLIVNTVGILEIIYLVWFKKNNNVGDDHFMPESIRKHVPEKFSSPAPKKEEETEVVK